jgi:aspartate/methionine/tyrosine aminotransferase
MQTRPDLDALVQMHRHLDSLLVGNRSSFLSDWNCDNPLLDQLLGPELGPKFATLTSEGFSHDSYVYFDADSSLLESICRFHEESETLSLSHSNVVAGPGSSSFLAAFAIWLLHTGYTEVYYIPPLYHTFYFLLGSLGIKLTPVSTLHAYEAHFSMNLPSRQTVLLMCDPVWYAGKCMPVTHVLAIADWQRATRSLVFVDGSFQYMKWNHERNETTAILDPELTFRLVCPAKALAVPFFRFAYLLHPSVTHANLVFLYESIVGGANIFDLAFAHRALRILTGDGYIEHVMPEFFKRIFYTLMEQDLIRTRIIPDCGYFAFAEPVASPGNLVIMDQSYFELSGYSDYCRINLMAARRIYELGEL